LIENRPIVDGLFKRTLKQHVLKVQHARRNWPAQRLGARLRSTRTEKALCGIAG
jgi:hypothetical protein